MHAAARVHHAIVWSGLGRSPCWRSARHPPRSIVSARSPRACRVTRRARKARRLCGYWRSAVTPSGKTWRSMPAAQRGKVSELPRMLEEMKAANIDVIVTVGYRGRAVCQGLRHSGRHRLRQRRSGCDGSGGQPGASRRHRHRNFRRRGNHLDKAAVVAQAIAAQHAPGRDAVEPG